ncbi:transmembrane protein 198 [Exaiptasia diaphana]|uniref:Transmembrane protein 198 n=1 Tax=Exaiptasia diaphana TaxID=2652724 RepID=A0A913XMB2_EXADI|nr:transmembrane protein 198 [Exaiptasia diaphana]KXJ29542.1 Transmembrane protein 198 [Exaiptasia diaphana]
MDGKSIPIHGDSKDCELHNTYDVQFCVLAAVSVLLGSVMCFCGYKFFKFILFCSGFLIGFFITYTLCAMYLTNLSGSLLVHKQQLYLGIAAFTGLISGIIALCVFYLGLFVLGATMGWFVGMAFLPLLSEHSAYLNENTWLPFVILFACAILGGILIICLQKIIIIIATSFLGAFCITNGLDYYIENNVTLYYSIKVLHGSVDETMKPRCWYTWTVFAFIPILFIAGLAIQFAITSKGKDHTRGYDRQRTILVAPPPDATMMQDFADTQPLVSNQA